MDLQEMKLKNGSILVSVTGYGGEEDFYAMYHIIEELLEPEHITFGVDSMCVDGSFRKDGLLVRMSSEGVTDWCCFHYDGSLPPADVEKINGWIEKIAAELRRRRPK